MKCVYNFTLEELKEKVAAEGFKPYRAKQVFGWVYKRKVTGFDMMANISRIQREKLAVIFSFCGPEILKKEVSKDKTKKLLLQLKDRKTIETVLIPDKERNTLCVSTQVGCRFNCRFCASKEGGFSRNLEVFEIIGQYLIAARKEKITNLVYMGVGEPLDNFENTVKSIQILTEPAGVNFTKKRISLSTCGLPDKIKRLADLNLGIKLSISLHAASQEKRSFLMPVSKEYSLKELVKAAIYYRRRQKYPVTFEYILIEGFNTTEADAKSLAKIVRAAEAKLNLIPCNPGEGKYLFFNEKAGIDFQKKLKKEKIISTLRKSRGPDIKAACGQLRSLSLNN